MTTIHKDQYLKNVSSDTQENQLTEVSDVVEKTSVETTPITSTIINPTQDDEVEKWD
jgi:hypothetical protein